MPTLTRVQHNYMPTRGTTATSLTATLSSGVTSGNLLVATITVGTNVGTVTPPSGWQQAGPTESVTSYLQQQIWYLVVGTGGATSFVFSWSGSHSFGWTIDEWNSSTGWLASPVDITSGNVHSTPATGVDCGSPGSTSQAVELWYGVLSWANSGQSLSGVTSGWTTGDTAIFTSNNTNTSFYQITSSSGVPSLAATISSSQPNAGVVATFQPAGGSVPVTMAVTAAASFGGTKTGLGHVTPAATAHSSFAGTKTGFGHLTSAVTAHLTPSGIQQSSRGFSPSAAVHAVFNGIRGVVPVFSPSAAAHAVFQPIRKLAAQFVSAVTAAARFTGTPPPRTPKSLAAVATIATLAGTAMESGILPGGSITLVNLGGTLTLTNFGGGVIGWTMQNVNLNFAEFNDISLAVTITSNGSPLNLTGYTVKMLLKPSAGIVDSDGSVITLSSSGGSPAITITSAVNGQCTVAITHADLQNQTLGFYRIDAVDASANINTAIYGTITYTPL